MEDDPAYPALFAEAKARAVTAWEDEAVRRATEGVFEPNTYQGEFVYPVKGWRGRPGNWQVSRELRLATGFRSIAKSRSA